MNTYFHLAAYRATITNGLVDAAINAVQDNQLTISNNNFVLPKQAKLLWAAGFGTNLNRLRLNTPKMRYVSLPSLVPINAANVVPANPNIVDYVDENIILDTIDEVGVQGTHTDAAPQALTALLAFGFGFREVPAQPVFRVRATATITQVAGSWVNGNMTFDQTLPRGTYHVVGLDVVGANCTAARLVFAGGGYRPGTICRDTAASNKHRLFDSHRLGVFGTFDSINTPSLDIFALGAGATQTVFLDLIRDQGPSSSGY